MPGATPNGGDGAAVDMSARSAEQLNVLEDACERVAKRLCHYARRTAKDSRTFQGFADTFREHHRSVVREMLAPSAALMQMDVELVTTTALDCVRDAWQSVYDSAKPAEFVNAVETCCVGLETGGLYLQVEQGVR